MDRRIRTFLCTIIMLLPISGIAFTAYAETAKAAANSNEELWKAAYKDVLRTGYTEEILQGLGVRYTIWDISGDNQPELIVTTRTNDADHVAAVYTAQDGVATKIGDVSVFTGSMYGDVAGSGLYLFKGYMGSYGIEHIIYDKSTGMHSENLLSEVMSENEYNYPEITEYIPGARRLALVDVSNFLLMEEYGSVPDYFSGIFPKPESMRFPDDDPNYFMNIIVDNRPVTWSRVGYGKVYGSVPFRTLLEDGVLSYSELEILQFEVADLDGDGKAECVLDLFAPDSNHSAVRLYLCELNGNTHVFVGDAYDEYSYTFGDMTTDRNGNILLVSKFSTFPEERYLVRLVFDGAESFLQRLPEQYYAPGS